MSDTEVQQLVIYVGTQAKIDEARQSGTIGPDDFAVVTDAPEFALQSTVQAIQVLIPNQASAENQLADKDFVNSSIATNTGNFIGTFNSVEERDAYTGDITNNDYCFVINGVVTDNGNDWSSFSGLDGYDKSLLTNYDYGWVINGSKFDLYRFDIVNQVWELRAENIEKDDVSLNTAYNRYKATVAEGSISWEYEYTLNNSSFTAAQWLAINSGATQENIAQITTNKNAIGVLSNLTTTEKSNLVGAINELQSGKQNVITGGASTITTSNLTANRALISNAQGKVAVSPTTNTELGYLSGATSSIQTQLNGKASTSLDNLSSVGQMIIDSQNGTISNCILEIPQDINLTLSSGTLTLKKGSVITLPNGTQLTTTADLTTTTNQSGKLLILVTDSGNALTNNSFVESCCSGTTDSLAGTPYHFWFDTANTVINYYGSNGSIVSGTRTLPIALVTVSNGAISSIDQVFNGFGYIGNSYYITPNVKALAPNGLNTDGTLKNTLITTSALTVRTITNTALINGYNGITISSNNTSLSRWVGEVYELPANPLTYTQCYLIPENRFYNYSGSAWQVYTGAVLTGSIYGDSTGKISSMTPRQPVRLATTEMLDELQPKIDSAIQGVQVSGTDLTPDANKKVNIPKAGSGFGVAKINTIYGIGITANGELRTSAATDAEIESKSNTAKPLVPASVDKAVREGLGNNSLTWTEAYKTSARNTIGAEAQAIIQTLSATDSITLADNTIYNGGEQTSLTIALPVAVDVSFLCEIDFTSGTTATTLSYPNTIKWAGDDVANNVFIPVASKRYTVIISYDGVNYRATVKGV